MKHKKFTDVVSRKKGGEISIDKRDNDTLVAEKLKQLCIDSKNIDEIIKTIKDTSDKEYSEDLVKLCIKNTSDITIVDRLIQEYYIENEHINTAISFLDVLLEFFELYIFKKNRLYNIYKFFKKYPELLISIQTAYPEMGSKLLFIYNNFMDSSCKQGLIQATGTCYFNSVLNGILISPRLTSIAFAKLEQYMNRLAEVSSTGTKHTIHCSYITDPYIRLRVLVKEGKSILQTLQHLVKKIRKIEEYDEFSMSLSSSSINTDDNAHIIYVSDTNKDEIATFLVMKTLYLIKCKYEEIAYHLTYQKIHGEKKPTKETLQQLNPEITEEEIATRLSCPISIQDYIQLLAAFTLYIHKDVSDTRHIIKDYKPITTRRIKDLEVDSSVPLYLKEGGFALDTFRTILKYIYGYPEPYHEKIRIFRPSLTITENSELLQEGHPPDILIIGEHYQITESQKIRTRFKKAAPDYYVYDYNIYNTGFKLKESIIIHGIEYILDHLNISITLQQGGHSVIGIICEGIPVIIDSNHPSKPFVYEWRNKDIDMRPYIEKIYPSYTYEKNAINYICYVRKDIDISPSPMICQKDTCSIRGGRKKTKGPSNSKSRKS